MPDEGRNVRGDDVETRVRIPSARAVSGSRRHRRVFPRRTPLPASHASDAGRQSRVIWLSGFDSRLVHVVDCCTDSSGSPHLGYPSLGRPGYPGV